MDFVERYSNLISTDKNRFQRICRKLLKTTFIVKEKDSVSRSDFFFITRNLPLFSGYFQIIGYDVAADETVGVAMLKNSSRDESGGVGTNRFRLKMFESVVLCALWLVYENRMTSGGLGATVIQKNELNMEIERLGYRDKIDKNKMQSALDLFADFDLIEVNGKVTDHDCNIKLFSSLQFCLSGEDFKTFVTAVAPKFQNRKTSIEDDEALTENDEENI